MEGVGSRLGRTSSRYGPVASAPVFNGPVRKWKRQWVMSRPNNSNKNGRSSGESPANSLFLFRWTPLPSDDDSVNHSTKRKLRYTPVVALEEKKRKADVEDDETSKMNQSTLSETPTSNDVFEKLSESSEVQLPSNGKHLSLNLFDDDSRSSGQTEETQEEV